MNQAFCVGVLDRLAALEARVSLLDDPLQPAPAEACTEIEPKRKPGRPPKGQDHGTATPTA